MLKKTTRILRKTRHNPEDDDSLSYLEFEQQNGLKEVYEVTKHFDPEISFFYLTAIPSWPVATA